MSRQLSAHRGGDVAKVAIATHSHPASPSSPFDYETTLVVAVGKTVATYTKQ